MALSSLASLSALGVRISGGIAAGDSARAQAALDDASNLIRDVLGDAWLDADMPPIVETICLQVARRAFLNPDGFAQKTVDDVSVTYARDAASGNGVFLTKEEKNQLLAVKGTARMGLWSLRTTRGDDGVDQYVDVVGQDKPMPFLPAGE